MKVYDLSLVTLEGGAVVEATNIALEKAFEDFVNLNKKASAKREVVLTISILPQKDLPTSPVIRASVKVKTAPFRDIAGNAYISVDGDGKISAVKQVDPEQQLLPLGELAPVASFEGGAQNGGSSG